MAVSTFDRNRYSHFSIMAAAALGSWCPDSRRYHAACWQIQEHGTTRHVWKNVTGGMD